MPRVFVSRRLPGNAIDQLRGVAEVDLWPGELPPEYDELARRVAGADGVICLLTDRIDRALLAQAPGLRVISNVAVGYDNIDIAAASERGIPRRNTPGMLTETTADLAFALMLACARRIVEAERLVRDGGWRTWDPGLLLGHDVHGRDARHRRLRQDRAGGRAAGVGVRHATSCTPAGRPRRSRIRRPSASRSTSCCESPIS